MKKLFILSTLFVSTILSTLRLNGQDTEVWKGFTRYNFIFEQREARLVVPDRALSGNPWVWRARFPDWHTEADSILLSRGFHIAYVNTDHLFGSPEALDIWDSFFRYLTGEYNLQQKVALTGVSRGGLFVYNWAKRNPGKVSCIYAEAPVCDFKSWPGGLGSGLGSSDDWLTLKKVYGFSSDDQAKAYSDNPINNLEALAAAKVPVLHMIGLEDKYVPAGENTSILIQRYIHLGGIATVVPCTEGEQTLEGHHFPIETPTLVADFIQYHSLQHRALDASSYHQMPGSFQNSLSRFEHQKTARVAFLGGSITYNPGWRDRVCHYLAGRFPETNFSFIEAGIPSMGSTPAAFRLERDVLVHGQIDLLFEEAAVNDATNGRTNKEQIRAMEGIIRHLRKANPDMDIVMMHFADPDKMKDYRAGKEPVVITNHNLVADHYLVPTINLAKEVTDRIDHGEFTWEDDFKNLHPSPFGQGVYARSIISFLENAYAEQATKRQDISTHSLPGKLDDYCYESGYLLDISSARISGDWFIDTLWNPNDGKQVRQGFVDVPMLTCTKPGSMLKLKFEGKAVGIAVAAGRDAGMIEYRIDKQPWKSLNLFTRWSSEVHLPWYYTLAAELNQKKHLLEIRILENRDERSSGNACRIRNFFVNRH